MSIISLKCFESQSSQISRRHLSVITVLERWSETKQVGEKWVESPEYGKSHCLYETTQNSLVKKKISVSSLSGSTQGTRQKRPSNIKRKGTSSKYRNNSEQTRTNTRYQTKAGTVILNGRYHCVNILLKYRQSNYVIAINYNKTIF